MANELQLTGIDQRPTVYPFGSPWLLAVPVADIKKWRRRMDIIRPAYQMFDASWFEDKRYDALLDRCERNRFAGNGGSLFTSDDRYLEPLYVFSLISWVVFELNRNPNYVGLEDASVTLIDKVMRMLRMPTRDRLNMIEAINIGIETGWLTQVNAKERNEYSAYSPPKREQPGTQQTLKFGGIRGV